MPESKRSRKLSVAEYLDFELNSKFRHEYVRGEIFAMTGASLGHNRISINLITLINGLLDGTECTAFISDVKVHVKQADCIYYPDVILTCEKFSPSDYTIESPVIIFEVLSPSTKQTDQREKLVAYKMIDTLQQYIMVHQDRMKVEVHQRVGADLWDHYVLLHTASMQLEICKDRSSPRIPVDAIYKGITFTPMVREEEEEYQIT